jgi:hypothetical protein
VSARLLALALALQAPVAPAAHQGTLVLCGERFELPEALAHELAGDAPHLVLELDETGLDPLARSASRALRPDLAGDWSAGREAALLPELERSQAVVVTARTWIACWRHFKPEQKDSRLEVELRAAWRAGRPVVATGAAAAYCAGWSLVAREELQRTQRNPRQEDPNLAVSGLDLAPGWMVDTSTQEAPGALRLLRASQRTGNARALYLRGPVAWIVRGAAQAEVAGSGSVAVFDLAHARRSRADLEDGRLLLLGDGDRLRLGKELELVPARPAGEPPAWKQFGLPFEPRRAGSEYRFDWIAQR